MRAPEKGGSRTPWQGPAPETSEAPPSTATVGSIVTDPELLCRLVRASAVPGSSLTAGALPAFLVDRLDELDRRAVLIGVCGLCRLSGQAGPA